ncbi:ALP1-like protein, partial [Tanacetum coccineum]
MRHTPNGIGLQLLTSQLHWEWKNYHSGKWHGQYGRGRASFVKSFTVATDPKHTYFKQRQESARKDFERAFGVLPRTFGDLIHPRPVALRSQSHYVGIWNAGNLNDNHDFRRSKYVGCCCLEHGILNPDKATNPLQAKGVGFGIVFSLRVLDMFVFNLLKRFKFVLYFVGQMIRFAAMAEQMVTFAAMAEQIITFAAMAWQIITFAAMVGQMITLADMGPWVAFTAREEARIAKDVEANQKRFSKELEKQDITTIIERAMKHWYMWAKKSTT